MSKVKVVYLSALGTWSGWYRMSSLTERECWYLGKHRVYILLGISMVIWLDGSWCLTYGEWPRYSLIQDDLWSLKIWHTQILMKVTPWRRAWRDNSNATWTRKNRVCMTNLGCSEVVNKQLKQSGRWAPHTAMWQPSQHADMAKKKRVMWQLAVIGKVMKLLMSQD
jgi:hypothetical protein